MSHFSDPASSEAPSGVLPTSFPWLILAGFIAGIAMSLPLWLSRRHFPMVPCFDWLPRFPAPWDAVVLCLAVLPLFPALWRAKWARLAWVSLGAFLLLALQDQVRWQPWVYQYFLALAVWFALHRRQPEAHAAMQRLMIVAIYLWSGLHKLGPGFRHLHEEAFVKPMHGKLPEFLVEALAFAGPLVPWIEVALAISLLVPALRKASVAGILLMHGYIVWSLVWVLALPNTVVLPWNVCMMVLVPLLFWRKHRIGWPSLATGPALPLAAALAFLLAVAPVLSLWEKWDRYLAFHLYSGKERRMVMVADRQAFDRLPPHLQAACKTSVVDPNMHELHFLEWCLRDNNVPVPSEPRILLAVARHLAAQPLPPEAHVRFYTDYHFLLNELGWDMWSRAEISAMETIPPLRQRYRP